MKNDQNTMSFIGHLRPSQFFFCFFIGRHHLDFVSLNVLPSKITEVTEKIASDG
jgi:hypothetical protein